MCVLRVSFIIWFFTSPTNLLRSSHHHLRADSAHKGKSVPFVQSGGSLPQKPRPMSGGHWSPDNPSSNQGASGRRRERVEWLSGPEYCSHRGRLLLVCRGGLVSVVVCGPFRWLLVVVVAEQPGLWARGFRDVGSSPTVAGWSPV